MPLLSGSIDNGSNASDIINVNQNSFSPLNETIRGDLNSSLVDISQSDAVPGGPPADSIYFSPRTCELDGSSYSNKFADWQSDEICKPLPETMRADYKKAINTLCRSLPTGGATKQLGLNTLVWLAGRVEGKQENVKQEFTTFAKNLTEAMQRGKVKDATNLMGKFATQMTKTLKQASPLDLGSIINQYDTDYGLAKLREVLIPGLSDADINEALVSSDWSRALGQARRSLDEFNHSDLGDMDALFSLGSSMRSIASKPIYLSNLMEDKPAGNHEPGPSSAQPPGVSVPSVADRVTGVGPGHCSGMPTIKNSFHPSNSQTISATAPGYEALEKVMDRLLVEFGKLLEKLLDSNKATIDDLKRTNASLQQQARTRDELIERLSSLIDRQPTEYVPTEAPQIARQEWFNRGCEGSDCTDDLIDGASDVSDISIYFPAETTVKGLDVPRVLSADLSRTYYSAITDNKIAKPSLEQPDLQSLAECKGEGFVRKMVQQINLLSKSESRPTEASPITNKMPSKEQPEEDVDLGYQTDEDILDQESAVRDSLGASPVGDFDQENAPLQEEMVVTDHVYKQPASSFEWVNNPLYQPISDASPYLSEEVELKSLGLVNVAEKQRQSLQSQNALNKINDDSSNKSHEFKKNPSLAAVTERYGQKSMDNDGGIGRRYNGFDDKYYAKLWDIGENCPKGSSPYQLSDEAEIGKRVHLTMPRVYDVARSRREDLKND